MERPTENDILFKSKNGNLLNGWFLKPKNIILNKKSAQSKTIITSI